MRASVSIEDIVANAKDIEGQGYDVIRMSRNKEQIFDAMLRKTTRSLVGNSVDRACADYSFVGIRQATKIQIAFFHPKDHAAELCLTYKGKFSMLHPFKKRALINLTRN